MSHRTTTRSSRTWKERAVCLLLTAVMLLGLTPGLTLPASAHWADEYLDQLVDWGIIRADQAGDPNAPITRADFMAAINRAYGYSEMGPIPFEDVSTGDWFYDDVCIAYTAGYMAGTSPTTASPKLGLTREQAVCILGRNMMLEETPGESLAFADSRSISSWARGLIKTAVNNYIVSGYPDNTFGPQDPVSKGQMAVLITQCLGHPIQKSGDYSLGGVFGNVTITSPGVTLRDTTISGDLYISGGVGLGGIKLENVNVLGRIVVSGTGESEAGDASVVMRNVTAEGMLVDNMRNKTVTIRADGITDIKETIVRTPAYLEDNNTDDKGLMHITLDGEDGTHLTLAGRIKEVTNKTPNSTIQVAKGTVAKLTVDEAATNSVVQLDRNTVVKEMNLDVGTSVVGEGDIEKLNINAPGSVVSMLPDKIYIRPGLTANIAGVIMDHVAAEEGSTDPRLLSGYPAAKDIAPTAFRADFAGNKQGTIYWAVSAIADGSIGEDDLIAPPSYGNRAVRNGSVTAPTGGDVVSSQVTGLTVGGSYYLSAILVDSQQQRSPVKVISFSTPDNTVPAFGQGYPYMSLITRDVAQVTVMPTKTCKLYYALLPQGAQAPTAEELKSAAVIGNLGYGVRDVTKNTEDVFTVNNQRLEELKTYTLYLWLTDVDGGNSSAVQSLPVTVPDETPPVVTPDPAPATDGVGDTTLNLTTGMDEAGTIYWAIVPQGTAYPLPNNASVPPEKDNVIDPETGNPVSALLDSMYAKTQVQSGRGALRRGQVAVPNKDTSVTINITGLTSETTYDLYYVGRDTAGNYSVEVKKVTVSTADNSGPVVYQYFTKPQNPDNETETPLASTDIVLDFNEHITINGSADILTLYQTSLGGSGITTDEKNLAASRLYTALSENFRLKQRNSQNPSLVTDVPEKGTDAARDSLSWIDYHEVVVRESETRPGHIEVVFLNDKAISMASGTTYYFELRNIRDVADVPNRTNPFPTLSPPILADITNTPHVLKEIETVFASVGLALSGGNSPVPVWVDNTDGADNDQGKKGSEGANLARVDAGFFFTPESTESSSDSTRYDIVLFSEKPISYDLYYRVLDKNTGNVIDDSALHGTQDGVAFDHRLTDKTPVADEKNGWVYLGNAASNQRSGQDWDMSAVHQNVIGNGLSPTYPLLKDLSENYTYEFAISVTEYDGSNSWESWNGRFNVQVCVAAGNQGNLRNALVARTATPDNIGSQDGVQVISTPNFIAPLIQFVDSMQPQFFQTQPTFGEGDTFQNLTFGLDNPGTLYYVVAPRNNVTNPPLPATITTKKAATATITKLDGTTGPVTVPAGNTLNASTSTDADKFWAVITAQTASSTRGDLVPSTEPDLNKRYLEYYQVDNLPNRNNIVNARNVYRQYISGSYTYNSRDGAPETLTIPDPTSGTLLDPLNEYYIYIVLEGASGNPASRSNVYIYNFKTTETAKPKINLRDGSGGRVRVNTNNVPAIQANIDYVYLTTSQLTANSILTQQFFNGINAPSLSDNVPNSNPAKTYQDLVPNTYKTTQSGTTTINFRVIDALIEADTNGYSFFDNYADPGTKAAVADIVRRTSAGGDAPRGNINPVTNSLFDEKNVIDKSADMRKGEYYYVIAVGHHISGTTDGYRAISRILVPDPEPPRIDSLSTSGSFDTATKKFTGTLTINFTKPVYWVRQNDPNSVGIPVANNENNKPTSSVPNDPEKDYYGVLKVLGGAATPNLTIRGNAGTSAAQSFVFNVKDAELYQDIVIFRDDGRIANASGQSDGQVLTLRLVEGPVQTGNLTVNRPYFTVTYTDSNGQQVTVSG